MRCKIFTICHFWVYDGEYDSPYNVLSYMLNNDAERYLCVKCAPTLLWPGFLMWKVFNWDMDFYYLTNKFTVVVPGFLVYNKWRWYGADICDVGLLWMPHFFFSHRPGIGRVVRGALGGQFQRCTRDWQQQPEEQWISPTRKWHQETQVLLHSSPTFHLLCVYLCICG